MKRIPIIPTIIVLIAVAVMVRLGLFELERLQWKENLLAQYEANATLPTTVFPANSYGDDQLFRQSGLNCSNPGSFKVEGAGKAGWRIIATCAGGARVQLGTDRNPKVQIVWNGGRVTGTISHEPDHRTWIEAIFDSTPQKLMLVADPPIAGLQANAKPDPSTLPNNHLSYAVQWFLFALTALVIYGLALRKRLAAAAQRG
jgi:surfeit locus 1 family protein